MTLQPPHTEAVRQPGVESLERALHERTGAEVRFDAGSRALYATDASNYRQVPIGVVIPRSIDDVVAAVAVCREHDVPVLSRGGGTSLCGQGCNVAVVIDFSKYLHRVIEIDAEHQTAWVEPGVVLDELRKQASAHGLTFAPDPATHTHNTLGGMIGNNSCGPHSVMGGETVHNVIELDVLTYDGLRLTVAAGDEAVRPAPGADPARVAGIVAGLRGLADELAEDIRARFPPIPRRVSGYNLPALLPENGFNVAQALVGSEGTCVVVLGARLRLLPDPPARCLLVLGYPSVYEAADHVTEVMAAGPIAVEGLDDRLIEDMKRVHLHSDDIALLPPGRGWLLVEFGCATREEAGAAAQALVDSLQQQPAAPSVKRVQDDAEMQHLWKVRESGLGATAHVPGAPITWEGWEDSSVPPARLGEYLRALRALFDRYGYGCDLYGHFGQGCVHTRIDFGLQDAPGIARYKRFIHEAAALVVRLGGSVSGEHGDGQSKAELLPIMFGDRLLRGFERFKALWDPRGRMNPGKVVRAHGADEDLRLGAAYRPAVVETRMFFASDGGDFARANLRCVGVGECRKHDGTMCPSYQVTGEEMHSTRGRAHLLFEMLNAERPDGVLPPPWQAPAVKEALALCLSCKACRHECPVKVDMAAFKAEFMSHWYEHHRRPLSAHLFGRIDRWARWASRAPALVNALAHAPLLSDMGKRWLGLAPQRALPRLARRTFRHEARWGAQPDAPPVLLWPDTFNNHFHPQVAHAAVRVLRHAGFDVQLPPGGLCCGRPLYEFGFLDEARRQLQRILEALGPTLQAGVPIVVLEPACLSVFKAELPMLLPHDEQARRLADLAMLLPDFLQQRAPRMTLQPLEAPALLHGHCHHKAVAGFDAEVALLRDRAGLQVQVPDAGCCGMAGSFGFQAHSAAVATACGERVLLPAVRQAASDALIVADGFSCREQIRQGTGRAVLHTAEVLDRALTGARP